MILLTEVPVGPRLEPCFMRSKNSLALHINSLVIKEICACATITHTYH